jgi:phosphoribosylamine--glycine ligase
VTKAKNFKSAKKNCYKILEKINWENGFYRKDIGNKVI